MALSISRRDSLLEKEAMFRDSGGALTQQPSLDNGLDGPYPSAAGKLEQVRGELRTVGGNLYPKECVKKSLCNSHMKHTPSSRSRKPCPKHSESPTCAE